MSSNPFQKLIDPIGLFTSPDKPSAAANPIGKPATPGKPEGTPGKGSTPARAAIRDRASTILTDELGVGSSNGKRRQLGVG